MDEFERMMGHEMVMQMTEVLTDTDFAREMERILGDNLKGAVLLADIIRQAMFAGRVGYDGNLMRIIATVAALGIKTGNAKTIFDVEVAE